MFNGLECTKTLKKKVLYRYVRTLEKMDSQLARHLLTSQREFFLAGKTFFDIEAGHAQKALNKISKKNPPPSP